MRYSMRWIVGGWFAVAFALSGLGALRDSAGELPWKIALAVVLPVTAFLLWSRATTSGREWVRRTDLSLLAGMHAWRFVGLAFLFAYSQHLLPGVFAWPAGLGDIAVAVAAPWIARELARDPRFAASGTFFAWNLAGLADLVVAVSLGLFSASSIPVSSDMSVMQELPLSLVPAFFVPLLVITHLVALTRGSQARQLVPRQAMA